MESTPLLYHTLTPVLGCHQNWLDVRHLKTLAWMINGVILSGKISLTDWAIYVQSRAQYLQSVIRRFRRFLDNERIEVHTLYAPLLEKALADWKQKCVYVALGTSMLWNTYCLIRLSLIYRGRAIPIVWTVLEHHSATVSFPVYRALVDRAAKMLSALGVNVIFLADRGFADTCLMKHLVHIGWHFRIRIKESFWMYPPGQKRRKIMHIPLAAGQAVFFHNVEITKDRLGPLHLALGRPLHNNRQRWVIISDQQTSVDTFQEFGLRFDIEENFLDDKSNGFQLESSLIRSASALERLLFVLAVATLYLVAKGVEVVDHDKRRLLDPHWFRGSSYLKIGWRWVKRAVNNGEHLSTSFSLSPEPDPQVAMASKKQHLKRQQPRFLLELPRAA